MNLNNRILALENELKKHKLEVYIPDQDNILTDVDELMELYHEIIQAGRENREVNHSLIDKGILRSTGVNSDTELVDLIKVLYKAGDRD